MQFRPAGRRVQVLAYRGYDKEKRRAVVKLLGSYGKYDFAPSDGLIETLTDDENKELQSHIESERLSQKKTTAQIELRYADRHIVKICDSIESGEYDSQMIESVTVSLRTAAERLLRILAPEPVQTKPKRRRKGGDAEG